MRQWRATTMVAFVVLTTLKANSLKERRPLAGSLCFQMMPAVKKESPGSENPA
jgi:hypothetical protein